MNRSIAALSICGLTVSCASPDADLARQTVRSSTDSSTLTRTSVLGDGTSFGSIEALVALADGSRNLVALDGMNGRLQLYNAERALLAQFGRTGGGPEEFRIPSAVDIDSLGRILVLDTGNRRISILSVASDAFTLVDTVPLPLEVSDLCVGAGRLFVLGHSEDGYVHELDLTRGILQSFGMDAPDEPLRAELISVGSLACSASRIAVVPRTIGEVWLFDFTGQSMGHYEIPDYSETVYEMTNLAFRPRLPEVGYAHRAEAVLWMTEDQLLIQLRRTRTAGMFEGRVLVPGQSWLAWHPTWPRLLAWADGRAYAYNEVPYPVIGIYTVE